MFYNSFHQSISSLIGTDCTDFSQTSVQRKSRTTTYRLDKNQSWLDIESQKRLALIRFRFWLVLLATDGDWSWGHRAPLSSDLFDTHTNTRENKRRVLVKHFTSSFQHFQLGFLIQGSEKELKFWGIFEFQGNILPSLWTEPRTHISIAFQLTQTWRQNSWKRLRTRERWSLQSASLCLVHRYVKCRKSEFRNKYVLA